MKDAAAEGRLLASIAQRGIEEPLEGVTNFFDVVVFPELAS
jgi:hypothetical protein